jgi:predicted dehydrogenase
MGLQVKTGIIGGGYIAGVHVAAAHEIPDLVDVVAVADVNHAAAQALVAVNGHGTAYMSVDVMLSEADLDAVIIATWPSTHLDLIEQCISAGVKHIVCEKPMVLTSAEALRVWETASVAGATVAEGFMYRYHPAIGRLDQLVASRELGEIDHVRASFTYFNDAIAKGADPKDPNRPWRFRADQGGGALYDIGAYAVNACGHFAHSLPVRVSAVGRRENEFGTIDKVIGLIEYENGVVGVVESSETSDATQEIEIFARRGTASIPLAWTTYGESFISVRTTPPAPWRDGTRVFRTLESRLAVPGSNAFVDQLRTVASAVRGDAQLMPLAESVVNTYVIEGLIRSVRERSMVELEIPDKIRNQVERADSKPRQAVPGRSKIN